MSDERIREALRAEPTATEREAEERAWRVVHEAFEQRSPTPPRRSRRTLALSVVGAAAIAGLVLSPAGAQVREWIADVVEPGLEQAAPTLTELPGGGRLLVQSEAGTWTAAEDGAIRTLGDYTEATFSPEGPFAAVVDDDRLAAVVAEPGHLLADGQPPGTVRWSVPGPGWVSDPRWAPSGFRVAYLSGGGLSVVAGDGTDDRRLDPSVKPVAPAWKPKEAVNRIAYVDANGWVSLLDVDSDLRLWSARPLGGAPRSLAWEPNGDFLAVLGAHGLSLLASPGGGQLHGLATFEFGRAKASGPLDVSPQGQIAFVRNRQHQGTERSELILIDSRHPGAGERRLFAGPGRFTDVAFSPNGEWILLGWKDADQWLFIRPSDSEVRAVSDISAQFDPASPAPGFPSVEGWCCR